MIYLFICIILILCFYMINFYIKFALKNKIIAVGKNNNLHKGIIPRGAGLIFGLAYLIMLSIAYFQDYINNDIYLPIFFGSLSCLILGFCDDVLNLNVTVKFLFQFIIVALSTFFFNQIFNFSNILIFNIFLIITIIIFNLWILNAYNFIDGSDGHLSTVASLQLILMISILYLNNVTELILPLFFLLFVILIFLKFNFPPAIVFMGDSGSLFIGINFIIFFKICVFFKFLEFNYIFIIFSYFLVDTIGTLLIRIIMGKNIFKRHTSHPYQNFVKSFGHTKLIKFVVILHLLWLLPLMILSNQYENFKFFFCLASVLPSLFFLFKYGPNFSTE